MKAITRSNVKTNNTIMTKEIDLAERIFVPDIGTIKGRLLKQNQFK